MTMETPLVNLRKESGKYLKTMKLVLPSSATMSAWMERRLEQNPDLCSAGCLGEVFGLGGSCGGGAPADFLAALWRTIFFEAEARLVRRGVLGSSRSPWSESAMVFLRKGGDEGGASGLLTAS